MNKIFCDKDFWKIFWDLPELNKNGTTSKNFVFIPAKWIATLFTRIKLSNVYIDTYFFWKQTCSFVVTDPEIPKYH